MRREKSAGAGVLRGIIVALTLALSGCASVPTCRGTQTTTAELLFGRNIGNRPGVSEAAFARFLAAEVTPRFPDGLTVIDAAGQWRDGERIVREPSKVVLIVLKEPAADQARLEAVVEAYKARFRQQSVGVVLRPACVSF
jgi:hypothetical protein